MTRNARATTGPSHFLRREENHVQRLEKFLKILGPGIITGASDDDPSGIATYSQTGAQFGYGQLWTALCLFPLLAGVQEACACIGVVTGKDREGPGGISPFVNAKEKSKEEHFRI